MRSDGDDVVNTFYECHFAGIPEQVIAEVYFDMLQQSRFQGGIEPQYGYESVVSLQAPNSQTQVMERCLLDEAYQRSYDTFTVQVDMKHCAVGYVDD